MMDDNRIIDKIKKCLALSKSDNQHEAAQALKHAHALMKKHQIDQDRIDIGDIHQTSSEVRFSLSEWHIMLIDTIEKVFTVVAIFEENPIAKRIRWNGGKQSIELASYAYEVLFKQCNQCRTNYLKTNLKKVRIKTNKTYRANQYAEGWVNAVYFKVIDLVSPEEKEQHLRLKSFIGKDLEFVKAKDKRSKQEKSKRFTGMEDLVLGYIDGKEANLFRSMPTTHQPVKAIE